MIGPPKVGGPVTLFLSWRFVSLTKFGRRLANVNYFFLRETARQASRYARRRSPATPISTIAAAASGSHIEYNKHARTI